MSIPVDTSAARLRAPSSAVHRRDRTPIAHPCRSTARRFASSDAGSGLHPPRSAPRMADRPRLRRARRVVVPLFAQSSACLAPEVREGRRPSIASPSPEEELRLRAREEHPPSRARPRSRGFRERPTHPPPVTRRSASDVRSTCRPARESVPDTFSEAKTRVPLRRRFSRRGI